MGWMVYLFANGVEIYQFKAKDFEINGTLLCFGNVSKAFSVDNMKNTGLNACLWIFSWLR